MKHLIPYFVQEQEQAEQSVGQFQAYTLFVDLLGFTPLTEGLMREGTNGAERLSMLLNEIFDPLIQLVYARGGFIPYFAGDAFTAIFPKQDERQSAMSLLQTAAMARALFRRRQNRFGQYTIGLKFGLSYGEVRWGIVGSAPKSFYFVGQPMESCGYCQTLAENEEIVIDGALLAQLPDGEIALDPVGEDAYKVTSNLPISDFPPPLKCDELSKEVALRFLPTTVVDYKQEGEFRPVASIFLSFTGVDTHEDMDRFASIVLEQCNSFAGYFKEIDFGDKGGVMTMFFGAPVAFEDNVSRALTFVLSLREELRSLQEEQGIRFRIGMTIGTAYTGIVGGYERCQYACVGNRVNLAARLMTKADWGEILVDKDIQRDGAFRFLHTGDIQYKGIKGNVPTFKLLGRNFDNDPSYKGPLVARDKELAQLSEATTPTLTDGTAGIAYLFGEAGVGKSRLTFELKRILQNGPPSQWQLCQVDQILHKPFNPFTYFLRNYFNQSQEEAEFTNLSNFEARYRLLLASLSQEENEVRQRAAKELIRTRPILAALLGLNYENSLWEQLDAKGRYQNSIQAIINLFLAESLVQPLIIELEDSHWIDNSSVELLQELVRQMIPYPIFLLITSRYADDGGKPYPLAPKYCLDQGIAVLEIELSSLPGYAVRAFAEATLGGPIGEDFHALLLRTTNNNPFYLEQMLEYFSESDLLIREADGWALKDEHVQLSNSINAILTARIDRLSDQVRETVKAAAVIGREFDVPVLTEVMKRQAIFDERQEDGPGLLRDEIKSAEKVKIWRAMNELRYIFRHSLLREAVYGMQLHTRLKQLHQSIGEAIERLYKGHLEERYVDLAYHYEQAGVFDKTCEYLRKAADFSRQNYLNQQALDYYEKLLHYLGAKADSADEIKTHLKRGKLLELVGNWEESQQAFEKALELAKHSRDVVMIGECNNHLGHLLMLKGDYFSAKHNLSIAAGLFESVDDQIGFAKVNGNLGNLHLRRGEYQEAKNCFRRSIQTGYVSKGASGGAQVIANLALTHMNLGEYQAAIDLIKQQLPLHRHRNDKQGVATLLVNLGIVQYDKGDYDGARSSYEAGLQLAEELGNKQLVSIAMGSLGLVIQEQGDYEKAMQLFERDLVITEELGDKQGIAIALGLIGELLSLKGEFHRAIEYLQKNLMLCEELGYQKGIAKAVNTLGDVFFFSQQFSRSIHFYERAIQVTRHIGNKLLLCQSLLEKGRVHIITKQLVQAQAAIAEALPLARTISNTELELDAQLIQAEIHHWDGRTNEALLLLDELASTYTDLKAKANINFLQWQFIPQKKMAQQAAIDAYKALFAAEPRYVYKVRLEELKSASN